MKYGELMQGLDRLSFLLDHCVTVACAESYRQDALALIDKAVDEGLIMRTRAEELKTKVMGW